MLGKTLNYISHHAIAILALVCSLLALAGASYAAMKLPKNSVGNRQIKRGAVAPPKFSKQIGGYVRMYAVVNANGRLVSSSPKARLEGWRLTPDFNGGTIHWRRAVRSSNCGAIATAQSLPGAASAAVGTLSSTSHGRHAGTDLGVTLSQAAGVMVAVVCKS